MLINEENSSYNDPTLDSLAAALNLLAEKLESEPQPNPKLNDSETPTDLVAEIHRLQTNQAQAQQALNQATEILRQILR